MSKRPDVHVCIDVDYCGKVYENCNYVQGQSVEEAYLRWLPAFGAKANQKNRKASIHMTLLLRDGTAVESSSDDRFPSAVERVVFETSGAWHSSCAICRALSEGGHKELLDFHRVEARPLGAAGEQDDEALIAELSAPTGSKTKHIKGKKHRGKDPSPEPPPAESRCVSASSTAPVAPARSEAVENDQALTTTESDRLLEDGCDSSLHDPCRVEDSAEALCEPSKLQELAVPSKAPVWRIQSEHSRTIDFGGSSDGDPDLHGIVEQLAGVVRNLATTVREESQNVARLREIVETDHVAMQRHLQEAREDRRLMMELVQTLARRDSEAAARGPKRGQG